jgi:hypothetical protein
MAQSATIHGFQAGNIDAIRTERVVCVVKRGDRRRKAFQVFFGPDGSLFVTFPYFRNRVGIFSSSKIPANETGEAMINLEDGGKVTSHLVKYSHHPDGRAHFSQTGKIFTEIKRQSIALETQHGHMFSLLIQGLDGLEQASPSNDVNSAKKTMIDFDMQPSEAFKFVGRWFDVSAMRFSEPTPTIGPVVSTLDPDGIQRNAILIASPYANAKHALALSCIEISRLGPAPESFMFYGGFDARETMENANKPAGFLAFIYPVTEADKLRERIGSVDYTPKS